MASHVKRDHGETPRHLLDGAHGQTRHHIALESVIENDGWNREQGRFRHHHPPGNGILIEIPGEADGNGEQLVAVDEDPGIQEFVPGKDEGMGGQGDEGRRRQGEDDRGEDPEQLAPSTTAASSTSMGMVLKNSLRTQMQ